METEVTWHHTWLANQQNAWHHRWNMLQLTSCCHNTATTDKPVFLLFSEWGDTKSLATEATNCISPK